MKNVRDEAGPACESREIKHQTFLCHTLHLENRILNESRYPIKVCKNEIEKRKETSEAGEEAGMPRLRIEERTNREPVSATLGAARTGKGRDQVKRKEHRVDA